MYRTRTVAIALALLLVGIARSVQAAESGVSLSSVLAEMNSLAALAEWPDPPFTCRQFSSYDPASKTPDDPKTWFANGDRGKYVRTEMRDGRKEFVMMDADGPGCVVRIWSANAGGVLRIYIDGSEKPALEMNMQEAMDGLHEPFLAPIAGVHARGWNLYFPFPYAKHGKVTTTDGNIYYHVNYRTYPAGTRVASFESSQLARVKGRMDSLGRRLAKPYTSNLQPANAQAKVIRLFELAPGASRALAELKGPAAVFEFEAMLDAEDLRQALRHTILEIAFDGESKPSVLCPLGDFFGSSPDINPYESLPLQVHVSGELRSKWFMPFAKSCTIKIVNRSYDPVGFQGRITTVPYRWSDRSMHFHAKWRAENNMPTRPFHDWTFVKCAGQGVFVGDMLSVANPVKGWWGEGDEKIYVDGEKFPSHFGTGSEDYFGYAWCCPDLFVHCYHNQPRCDGPGNYGLTSVNRFHVIDKIPFAKQFQFDIEAWHSNANTKVSYNATSYWYARPGGTDFFKPLTRQMLEVIAPPPMAVAANVKGALEGEALKIVRKTATADVQAGYEDLWSQQKQLWWRGAKPGDVLVLAFPVKAAGRHKIIGNFTRAPDYGIMQLSINDQKAGDPIDFYKAGDVGAVRRELGTFELKAGENQFKVEIKGANPKALPRYMFGLDYLLLEKAP
jgi:hypothetical protein